MQHLTILLIEFLSLQVDILTVIPQEVLYLSQPSLVLRLRLELPLEALLLLQALTLIALLLLVQLLAQ